MYTKILVPLDGSEHAEGSLPYAHRLADRFGSEVFLFAVRKPGAKNGLLFEAYLEKRAEALGAVGITAGWTIAQGHPADEILRYCERGGIDLIVMSTHGESGHTDWALGKVTGEVLQRAHIPVLLARSGGSNGPDADNPLANVLAPLDGSEFADQIIPYVMSFAQTDHAHVVLLRVIDPPEVPHIAIGAGGVDWTEFQNGLLTNLEGAARRYLDARLSRLQERGIHASTVILHGKPASSILHYVESNPVDVVALATHGFSGITKWAYGSVASRMIDTSRKPILLLRPPLPVSQEQATFAGEPARTATNRG